jgi:predicted DNA-binding protein with PD1-like motif
MPAHTTLATVPKGGDLLDSLAQLAKSGDAWFSATGEIEAVELLVAGEGADATRLLKGRFTLLSLAGPSKGPFSVTLARLSDAGIEVLGGVLVKARSAGVSVAVHAATATDAGIAASSASPWIKAAAVSAAIAAREVVEEVDELMPEAGDLVDHFAFGLCEVVTSDGDRLKIRDAKVPGRIREVSMTMLNVMQPTESEGKRLFRLARRGA